MEEVRPGTELLLLILQKLITYFYLLVNTSDNNEEVAARLSYKKIGIRRSGTDGKNSF